MKSYRVCVIGCGVIAPNHLEAIQSLENTTLVGVCDVIPARAEAAGKKYNCPAYTDYREMVQALKPDARILRAWRRISPRSRGVVPRIGSIACQPHPRT